MTLLGQFSPSVASWDPQNDNFSSPEKKSLGIITDCVHDIFNN